MSRIPIDKAQNADVHFRYGMDPIQYKIEGTGNGIYTVITNGVRVAEQLDRNVQYLMKIFGN